MSVLDALGQRVVSVNWAALPMSVEFLVNGLHDAPFEVPQVFLHLEAAVEERIDLGLGFGHKRR